MAKLPIFAFVILCIIAATYAQENADTNIAKSLRECYNNTEYLSSNKKRPMTMNYLIDLIRKVENGQDRMDIRMLSTSMLHRFRQDGILRATNIKDPSILPFSPYGDENKKFKILLHNIVPSSYLFPNDTLSPMERCTIHLMLSESVETRERGDEAQVCSKTGKYRLRTKRGIKVPQDVEIIDSSNNKNSKGNIQQINPNDQVGTINSRKQTSDPSKPESMCPLEYGVVYTKWGAVSAGSVIAGIAAGSEPMDIDIKQNFGTDKDATLDNVWGATLAGNIAEAGYLSKGNSRDIVIGADGGWDSTQIPHGYYVNKNEDLFFTDAEIRGDLDGLILGTKMKNDYRNSARNMKLSQLLDMYYSERGLFNENIKACRRNELLTEYAKTSDIEQQGLAFALILNKKVILQTTMEEDVIGDAIKQATSKFTAYVPSNLRDLSCMNNNEYQVTRTDLMIFLDFNWQYDVIEATLAYLLDNIDINPYNSNYTIVNAQTGELLLNSSNSIAYFYENFNQTFYGAQSKGFDLSVSISVMEKLTLEKMENGRKSNEPTSKSLIALFIANSPAVAASQKEFIINKLNDQIRPQYPDLRLLALTAGPKEMFTNIVKDPMKDVFVIQDNIFTENIVSNVGNLVTRIKQIPSRIISYKCSGNWTVEGEEKTLIQNIEPKSINYYRVAPNYFFAGDNPHTVKIKGQGQGSLIVCYSRDNELPRNGGNYQNNTTPAPEQSSGTGTTSGVPSGVTCKQISGDEVVIELTDPCYDVYTISECAPLYISVEAKESRSGNSETCPATDKNCRFTDNLKYTISTENFGCYSSAVGLFTNVFVLISMLCIAFARNINN